MGIQERKERERERRRQQIMVAAKRVFTDKGFSKATMESAIGTSPRVGSSGVGAGAGAGASLPR